MPARHHSSGQFTIDLAGAVAQLAQGVALNASEAVASLVAGFLLWRPTRLVIEAGAELTLSAGGLAQAPDLAERIATHVIHPPVPWGLHHLGLGLHSLLRTPLSEVAFHSQHSLPLRGEIAPQWPSGITGVRAQWRLAPCPRLDFAVLRRRLRRLPIPIDFNGLPLPFQGSIPASPEYLWECHDLHHPRAAGAFSAWSVGPAARSLGLKTHQPEGSRFGKVLLIGRLFEGGERSGCSYPDAHARTLFRSSQSATMWGPACSRLALLELKPRTPSRVIPVCQGFALDGLVLRGVEPGWRLWMPCLPQHYGPDLRSYLGSVQGWGENTLEWGRAQLDRHRKAVESARRALTRW